MATWLEGRLLALGDTVEGHGVGVRTGAAAWVVSLRAPRGRLTYGSGAEAGLRRGWGAGARHSCRGLDAEGRRRGAKLPGSRDSHTREARSPPTQSPVYGFIPHTPHSPLLFLTFPTC